MTIIIKTPLYIFLSKQMHLLVWYLLSLYLHTVRYNDDDVNRPQLAPRSLLRSTVSAPFVSEGFPTYSRYYYS